MTSYSLSSLRTYARKPINPHSFIVMIFSVFTLGEIDESMNDYKQVPSQTLVFPMAARGKVQ